MNRKSKRSKLTLASIVKKTAIIGSGLASIFGFYQPKVPKQLQK